MTEIELVPCAGVNCYLLKDSGGSVLVDTGMKGDRDKILKLCKNEKVRLIVLTHSHSDHALNASFLSRELGIPVALHEADYESIKSKTQECMSAHKALGKLMLKMIGMMNSAVDCFENPIFLKDGDTLEAYGVDTEVVGLPGHTRGSIGLRVGEGLIVGDALMSMFSPGRPMFYINREDMEKSAEKISASGAKTIYFGHGKPTENRKW
jgi:glyoxylase-like metal-dependent hydrolase (beta-lactamase superfamily II)